LSEDGTVTYSIVIPCYRSQQSLPELVERIRAALKPLGEPFEVILVNDASPDDTWSVIQQLAAQYPFVTGIDVLRNGGQYRAILCGLERVKGRWVILMDDDLQHPPEEIPVLIDAILARPDVDCVMGRYQVKHHGPIRNLGSALVSRLDTLLYDKPKRLVGSSFQIMTRQLARAVCQHKTANPILNPLIYRSTRRIANVPVRHEPRAYGRSGYRFRALVRLVLNNILSASNLPLRLISVLGTLSAAGSLLLGCFYLGVFLVRGIPVAGFTTQVLLIIFFGGMALLSVGIVGEYLLRILDEVRDSPRYVVRAETTRSPGPRDDATPGHGPI